MGLFPKIDVPAITAQLEAKFNELLAKLDQILQAIKETK